MFNGSPRNSTNITVDDVILRLMFLIPGSCTMNSSLKVHWKTSDEALLRYCGTQTVTAFKLLFNYYTQPRWLLTAGQVRRHAQLKHVNLLNYSSLSPRANFTLISFLLYKKKKKNMCSWGKTGSGGSGGSAVRWSIVK